MNTSGTAKTASGAKGLDAKTFLSAVNATQAIGGARDPIQALMEEYGWTEEQAREVYERTSSKRYAKSNRR